MMTGVGVLVVMVLVVVVDDDYDGYNDNDVSFMFFGCQFERCQNAQPSHR